MVLIVTFVFVVTGVDPELLPLRFTENIREVQGSGFPYESDLSYCLITFLQNSSEREVQDRQMAPDRRIQNNLTYRNVIFRKKLYFCELKKVYCSKLQFKKGEFLRATKGAFLQAKLGAFVQTKNVHFCNLLETNGVWRSFLSNGFSYIWYVFSMGFGIIGLFQMLHG